MIHQTQTWEEDFKTYKHEKKRCYGKMMKENGQKLIEALPLTLLKI